jgi:outer membrane protein OmpA-like peptidoglycan-associated protein
MSSSARTLALQIAAGSLLLGSAVATAAPSGGGEGDAAPRGGSGEAGTSGEAAAGLDGLRARADAAKRKAKATKDEAAGKAKAAKRKAAEAAGDDGSLSKRKDRPWVQRWAPERNMLELGAFGGVLVPARDLELFEPRPGRPRQGFLPLATVAPDVGVRVGYYPLRFLGLEAEGAIMPTSTLDDGYYARVWSARAHVVGQLPFSSIAPFVVVGAGALGVDSHALVLGDDVDPAFHLGIGTKIFIDRRFALRLDLRDVISPRRGISGGATNSIEALLGVSLTLGRLRDRDETPRPEPETSRPPGDADGDGFPDRDDACPQEAGVAPDGCPAPADPDGDGFLGDDDACPQEAGVAPDGCPDLDADRDGILVPDDACPDAAEDFNGFEDDDGCPDEVPDAVRQFTGRLDGVNFELSRSTLTRASLPVLDEAVKVLQQYPTVRIEISGHTDNTGGRETNMKLSQARADAVKKYLVDHGIDESRIVTRGAGPDEPIDSNRTREGRASNRRIEFRVLE